MRRRTLLATLAAPGLAHAQSPGHPLLSAPWQDVARQARGQPMFFNAWGAMTAPTPSSPG